MIMKEHAKAIAISICSATIALGATPSWAAGSHGHGGTAAIGGPGTAAKTTRTIEIKMVDSAYAPKKISVKEGETVRFIVRNEGELVHEFNIGTTAMHRAHQDEMMKMMESGALEADMIGQKMKNMGLGAANSMTHDDPNSILLAPGKTGEVVWTFAKTSNIEFACNVPGHYEYGMRGEIHFDGPKKTSP